MKLCSMQVTKVDNQKFLVNCNPFLADLVNTYATTYPQEKTFAFVAMRYLIFAIPMLVFVCYCLPDILRQNYFLGADVRKVITFTFRMTVVDRPSVSVHKLNTLAFLIHSSLTLDMAVLVTFLPVHCALIFIYALKWLKSLCFTHIRHGMLPLEGNGRLIS